MAVALAITACGSGGGNESRPPQSTVTVTVVTTPAGTPSPTPLPARAFAIATTDNSAGGILETFVLRSDDGGRNWLVLPRLAGDGRAIDFADREHGWIAGHPEVFRSADGGISWTVDLARTSRYRDVVAFSATSASVAGRILDFVELGAEVLTKRDGGDWDVARWQTSAVRLRGDLGFLCYTASGLGIAVGTVDGESALVLLRDRGATADEISDRIKRAPVVSGACAGDADLWAVGEDTTILRSTDGGLTWESRAEAVTPLFTGDLVAADFVDRATGWIAGERGGASPQPIVLHTADAGATWSVQTLPAVAAHVVAAGLDFVGSGAGVLAITQIDATGAHVPAVLVSSDFGATWELAEVPTVRILEDVTLVE